MSGANGTSCGSTHSHMNGVRAENSFKLPKDPVLANSTGLALAHHRRTTVSATATYSAPICMC